MEMMTSCGSASRTRSYFAKLAVMLSWRKDDSACRKHRDGSTVQKGGRRKDKDDPEQPTDWLSRAEAPSWEPQEAQQRHRQGYGMRLGLLSAPSIHYSGADVAGKKCCAGCVLRQEVTKYIEERESERNETQR